MAARAGSQRPATGTCTDIAIVGGCPVGVRAAEAWLRRSSFGSPTSVPAVHGLSRTPAGPPAPPTAPPHHPKSPNSSNHITPSSGQLPAASSNTECPSAPVAAIQVELRGVLQGISVHTELLGRQRPDQHRPRGQVGLVGEGLYSCMPGKEGLYHYEQACSAGVCFTHPSTHFRANPPRTLHAVCRETRL